MSAIVENKENAPLNFIMGSQLLRNLVLWLIAGQTSGSIDFSYLQHSLGWRQASFRYKNDGWNSEPESYSHDTTDIRNMCLPSE